MAKPGIKVKDLARELGITSRELIDRCRSEGLTVQNRITKLTPNQVKLVRSWWDDATDDTTDNADIQE